MTQITTYTRYVKCLTDEYNKAVKSQRIQSGVEAFGLWDPELNGVNPMVIKEIDITNLEGAENQTSAFDIWELLVQSFTESLNLLRSDGGALVNGTMNTKSGLL